MRRFHLDISPFQGSANNWRQFTQGCALGCHILPFAGQTIALHAIAHA
jgi:hypothetical protein